MLSIRIFKNVFLCSPITQINPAECVILSLHCELVLVTSIVFHLNCHLTYVIYLGDFTDYILNSHNVSSAFSGALYRFEEIPIHIVLYYSHGTTALVNQNAHSSFEKKLYYCYINRTHRLQKLSTNSYANLV